MSDKQKCPTCGGDVIVHSSTEGTGYYESVKPETMSIRNRHWDIDPHQSVGDADHHATLTLSFMEAFGKHLALEYDPIGTDLWKHMDDKFEDRGHTTSEALHRFTLKKGY